MPPTIREACCCTLCSVRFNLDIQFREPFEELIRIEELIRTAFPETRRFDLDIAQAQ